MKEKIKAYKEKLEKCIDHYTSGNVSESSARCADAYIKYWLTANEAEEKMAHSVAYRLTEDEIKCWNAHMVNEDGTMGGHWNLEQTNSVATAYGVVFEHITEHEWNVALNMVYSDYSKVADRFGVGSPEFYACIAKAFLFDKDGGAPAEKLCAYYHYIVEKAEY